MVRLSFSDILLSVDSILILRPCLSQKIRGSRLPSVELFLTLVEKASETLDFDKGLSWRRWLDVSHASDSEFVLLINHLS